MKVSLRALTLILIFPLASLAAAGANEPAGRNSRRPLRPIRLRK